MPSAEFWPALWLTLRLAAVTALLLVVIGLPLADWLNRTRSRGALWLEALVSLPVILPPTVIGFYLLVALGARSPLGRLWIDAFGSSLAFSFPGLVAGSVLYSLPYAVQPFQAALRGVDPALIEAAAALGASRRRRFWHIQLPTARYGIFTGAALAFAHTMGEFGVVLMLGGNIPGRTRVVSIVLYDQSQNLDFSAANLTAVWLLGISLLLLAGITWLRRR